MFYKTTQINKIKKDEQQQVIKDSPKNSQKHSMAGKESQRESSSTSQVSGYRPCSHNADQLFLAKEEEKTPTTTSMPCRALADSRWLLPHQLLL